MKLTIVKTYNFRDTLNCSMLVHALCLSQAVDYGPEEYIDIDGNIVPDNSKDATKADVLEQSIYAFSNPTEFSFIELKAIVQGLPYYGITRMGNMTFPQMVRVLKGELLELNSK